MPSNDPSNESRNPVPAGDLPNASPPTAEPTLADLRVEIDRIDRDLVALLNYRSEIAVKIGRIKQAAGLDIWAPAREEEVYARAFEASRGPLPDDTLRFIFRELISSSRSLQRQLRVACLGPQYSYSHLASVARFGESVEHVLLGSIAAVFEEVARRHVHFGIVPLENSTDGRIADTLDMFVRQPGLKIRAEVRLRVRHCLVGSGEWSQVRRVYSKAQAISQCRNWLVKNLPLATTVDVVSSAEAARIATTDPEAAAIASKPAADAHGLKVLVENIEDQSNNSTRFAVIAERGERPTGRDKTTLILRVLNNVGSLPRAIAPFGRNGVNMTWIESFPTAEPSSQSNPAYLFFADIEGHHEDEAVIRALDEVRQHCERLEILGSYPRSESVES